MIIKNAILSQSVNKTLIKSDNHKRAIKWMEENKQIVNEHYVNKVKKVEGLVTARVSSFKNGVCFDCGGKYKSKGSKLTCDNPKCYDIYPDEIFEEKLFSIESNWLGNLRKAMSSPNYVKNNHLFTFLMYNGYEDLGLKYNGTKTELRKVVENQKQSRIQERIIKNLLMRVMGNCLDQVVMKYTGIDDKKRECRIDFLLSLTNAVYIIEVKNSKRNIDPVQGELYKDVVTKYLRQKDDQREVYLSFIDFDWDDVTSSFPSISYNMLKNIYDREELITFLEYKDFNAQRHNRKSRIDLWLEPFDNLKNTGINEFHKETIVNCLRLLLDGYSLYEIKYTTNMDLPYFLKALNSYNQKETINTRSKNLLTHLKTIKYL